MTCTACAILPGWAGLGWARDAIPDETTILNFRHLLERHDLTDALFVEITTYLQDRALLLRGGTIMDATLIAASTKNKTGKRKRGRVLSSSQKKRNRKHGAVRAKNETQLFSLMALANLYLARGHLQGVSV